MFGTAVPSKPCECGRPMFGAPTKVSDSATEEALLQHTTPILGPADPGWWRRKGGSKGFESNCFQGVGFWWVTLGLVG